MLVAVTGFGSVWRHRLGKRDARDRLFCSTGVLQHHGRCCQMATCASGPRFAVMHDSMQSAVSIQNYPSRMINRVFECAEPSVWMGYNKLLFKRVLTAVSVPTASWWSRARK